MYTEHHHRDTKPRNTVASQANYVQWEVIETPQGSYEEWRPSTASPPLRGEAVLFLRYKTDDKNRNQYDLYAEYYLGSEVNKLWQEGANLYSRQCDRKVIEILNKEECLNAVQ